VGGRHKVDAWTVTHDAEGETVATIIAFAVPDAPSGREALDRLTGVVDDTALAYRDEHGVVTVRQCSDLDCGPLDVGHGLLGVAVALATARTLGMMTAGTHAERAHRELMQLGVDVEGLEIAGEQIEAGAAAAFMATADDNAPAIEAALRSAGYRDVRCVHVPEEGVRVLRTTQHLDGDPRPPSGS
jgi:hypothetical protein